MTQVEAQMQSQGRKPRREGQPLPGATPAKVGRSTGNSPDSVSRFSRIHFLRGNVRIAGHIIHVIYLWLLALELVTAAALMAAAQYYLVGQVVALPSLLFAGVLVVSYASMGLYDTRQRNRLSGVVLRIVAGVTFAMALCYGVSAVLPLPVTGMEILLSGAASLVVFPALRLLFDSFVDGRVLQRKILVLGTGKRARKIDMLRRKSDIRGFSLLGFLPSNGCQHCYVNPEKLLKIDDICAYALKNHVDEIVIALDDRRVGLPIDQLLDCRMSGIEVTDDLDFFEREAALVQLELIKSSWLIHAQGFTNNYYRYMEKRLVDIFGATIVGIALSPFILLTALAIRLESGLSSPVLYTQVRVGRGGKPFTIYKFRSMRTDAETSAGAQWASQGDSRVTRVGRIIRKCRLDETPQLWNILKGDMSLVGPRPERPEFVDNLSNLNSLYAERHRLAPGLTGWAQLCYPYGSSDEDSIEKLKYDLYYVKNHSVFLDLYILIQTVEVMLFQKGAR
ncbi:TIGR03013 family XrtA/PEP-CTERM system glycosyltransferase [Pseudomaricurvus sp. HS19]|uniref:TIGR03013 family XrtA/PEP-CTERM system glycosyltransferase n=1 Tax=Pseudomaricurvus sp. HS19 TaxID=2692626 RepID=UPI001371970D|nr:TIGR03013 family XrtA/PEP-CTERM system glycosyltransferase [Pseudomaricurvus sp. HS19]MYM62011.1 TIGR03013 family PEP-CTERM/XrtA system glycosyltransferase [Pseudomaricurvus sp. HS19]